MSQSTPRAEADVQAPLTFIVPQDSKPSFQSAAFTGGLPKIFFETEDRTVTIRDMRPLTGKLSLDRQGFELRRHETAVDDLYDDAAIEDVYEAELETLLKEATGADRVAVFDHRSSAGYPFCSFCSCFSSKDGRRKSAAISSGLRTSR